MKGSLKQFLTELGKKIVEETWKKFPKEHWYKFLQQSRKELLIPQEMYG